jgi:hypothetical protein
LTTAQLEEALLAEYSLSIVLGGIPAIGGRDEGVHGVVKSLRAYHANACAVVSRRRVQQRKEHRTLCVVRQGSPVMEPTGAKYLLNR